MVGTATYTIRKKTLANARRLKLTEVFYSTQRFAIDQFDAGAMQLVSVDLPGLPDLDALTGFDFFEKHRVCVDYARRTVSVWR